MACTIYSSITDNQTKNCISKEISGRSVLDDLGPTDPLNKGDLTARPNRGKIREQIADYVLLQLGAPVVRVELDQQQLDLCVDQALKIFEEWAPQSYFEYFYFNTVAGQSRYVLPPDIGIIQNVYWRQQPCYGADCLESELGGTIPLDAWNGLTGYSNFYYQGPVWGYAGQWVLFKQYEEMFSRLWNGLGGWEYCPEGSPTTIILYPTPRRQHWVIVHYLQKQKDWAEVHQFMQEYALANAKIILGRIRSKFTNIPAPGGGVQTDGQMLLQEGLEAKRQLEEDLIYKWQEPLGIVTG